MNAREMFETLGYECRKSENAIQYLSECGKEITFVFELHRFYKQRNFISLNIDIDEFKAIHQQMKELGWIAKEEKQETNYEHYKDEIIEDSGFTLALVGGKPCKCSSVNCSDCGFSTGHGCSEKIKEWLASTYEKTTYKLTQFEYDLINTYNDCHKNRKFRDCDQLRRLKNEGYFKCVNHDVKVQDVLKNCEVIK